MSRRDPDVVELLIVGGESDPNTRRIADQAAMRGVDFYIADTDAAETQRILWNLDEPTIDIGGFAAAPSAIFLRHNVFSPTTPDVFFGVREFVEAWPQINVLNRQTLGAQNSKTRNLRIAESFDLAIPETLVIDGVIDATTGGLHLPELPDLEDWVTKPLLGGAHTIPATELADAVASGDRTGLQFLQRRLGGANVRVFVIGGQTLSFHLDTELLDYREDHTTPVHHIDTPRELIQPCIDMARHIGFDYCAFDFRGTTAFEGMQFLEVNSFPMFIRFDMACENQLVDQMLTVLLKREIFEPNA